MHSRKRVALLIETSNGYARQLLQGVRSWQREHEAWAIRLSEHARGSPIPAWLRTWDGDGVIARVENGRISAALRALRLPVVDVSASLEGTPFPRFATDSEAATLLAAEHLREKGFLHFGYCGDARFLWSKWRGIYFRKQIAAFGASCSVFADRRTRAADGSAAEIGAIADWLKQLPKPVGVLACYDVRGQQVLEACKLAGLSVPTEVGVVGVHNDELLCELCDPPLTSVIPNARRAGYDAAALLAQMMRGKNAVPITHLLAPLGLAARQSTDVVAVDDAKVAAAARYIREHATSGIGVAEVLRAVPMSRTLLERRFRGMLGRTPGAHILRVKIEHVKMLLATTGLSVSAIADRAGFEHAEYLSVAFRRETGSTPTGYRASFATTGSDARGQNGDLA
jgi:LacI family transcriptional regulator